MNNPDSDPADPAESTDRRLRALEERLSFQQRLVDELYEVVLGQRAALDRLVRELAACRGAIDGLSLRGDDLPHEKPPHY